MFCRFVWVLDRVEQMAGVMFFCSTFVGEDVSVMLAVLVFVGFSFRLLRSCCLVFVKLRSHTLFVIQHS